MAVEIDTSLIVTPEAYPYLVLQKGALWHLKDQPEAWTVAYNASIKNQYETIRQYLPATCATMLDVGSGMGGIDAVINRHYGGDVSVNLLDGLYDAPVVNLHSQTFNDAKTACGFLKLNGVKTFSALDPEQPKGARYINMDFDLVISCGAWCFHFPPAEYIEFVRAHLNPGAVLILDVRNNKPEWLAELIHNFGKPWTIRTTPKFTKFRFQYAG